MERFNIADIRLELQTQIPIFINESFKPFQTTEKAEYIITYTEIPKLPEFPERTLYQESCFKATYDNGEKRLFIDAIHGERSYAVGTYDWNKKRAEIRHLPEGKPFLCETGNCFFHIAWESLLLKEKRMILHSCCIETTLGGILFSGRSGIGKSTQGNLWCEYEHARLINGDRSILYKKDVVWKAYGSPYAGSSRCYVNDSTLVRAIVMLKQAKSCSIRRLGNAEAFQKIYAQLTVNDWNSDFVNEICDLAEALITDIPVYELSCTPDRAAVRLLKETLEREGER